MALESRKPMPGMAKICSVTSEPVKSPTSSMVMTVMTGIMELRIT